MSDPIIQHPADAAANVPPRLRSLLEMPELNGSKGSNRFPGRCVIGAETDVTAVSAWLARATNPHTHRQYRKEIERFMLWCALERGKPLSSANIVDAQAYRAFLADPQPADQWLGRRRRRGPDWRPFERPLSANSIRQSMVIIGDCFRWLTKVRYLDFNVFDDDTLSVRQKRNEVMADRHLPPRVINWVLRWLATLERTPRVVRWHFTVRFLLMTGMRRDELASARMSDFQLHSTPEGDQFWYLVVVGKGGVARDVMIPDIRILTEFRRALKLTELPSRADTAPVWHPLRGKKCVGGDAIAAEFKRLTTAAAEAMEEAAIALTDEHARNTMLADAVVLRRSSPHWLRHAHGTQALAAGVKLRIVQRNLGHASLDTTTIYDHTQREEAYAAIAGWAKTLAE